ncbi:hypothetical protein SAMN05192529_103184 [Arachidicoccus rhizosphaerae]|jgi:hypothetical protein|uniref:Uncharacterized protein n=1 Tax=Arachidicoccus rhizosphaerae TaxID=551991 RepID=A0A1H3WR33_9BACT|nr:hypothetical protein SAMN05192529_103184 [Arachidicoccus rhizosphaerae]
MTPQAEMNTQNEHKLGDLSDQEYPNVLYERCVSD